MLTRLPSMVLLKAACNTKHPQTAGEDAGAHPGKQAVPLKLHRAVEPAALRAPRTEAQLGRPRLYKDFCSHRPVPSPARGWLSAPGCARAELGAQAGALQHRACDPATAAPAPARALPPGRGRALRPPRSRSRAGPPAALPPPGAPAAPRPVPRLPAAPPRAPLAARRTRGSPGSGGARAGSRPEPRAELRGKSQAVQPAQTSTFRLKSTDYPHQKQAPAVNKDDSPQNSSGDLFPPLLLYLAHSTGCTLQICSATVYQHRNMYEPLLCKHQQV